MMQQPRFSPVAKAIPLWVISGLFILTLPALACIPQMSEESYQLAHLPPQLLHLVSIASTSFSGFPLAIIIAIESFVLHKQLEIDYRKSVLLVTGANLFYLLYIASIPLLWPIFTIPGMEGIILATMCLVFCKRNGFWKNLPKFGFEALFYIGFILLDITASFLSSAFYHRVDYWAINYWTFYAATSALLLIGYLTSFAAKGFIIGLNLKQHRNLATTVMSMTVASFPVIALVVFIQKYAFSISIFDPYFQG